MKRTFEYSITVIVDGPHEIPSDDAIDHAQTTLREFEDGKVQTDSATTGAWAYGAFYDAQGAVLCPIQGGGDTPDIPGTTAYTAPRTGHGKGGRSTVANGGKRNHCGICKKPGFNRRTHDKHWER